MLKIIMLIMWLIVLFFNILSIKNENTHRNRLIIIHAIGDYGRYRMDNDMYNPICLKIYDYMEPYKRTLWRLWDWSYKNILPPDIYEIIKPFIKR